MVAASCCTSLYWAENSNSILGLCSVFVAMSSIGGACVVNIVADNFPTCLRCKNVLFYKRFFLYPVVFLTVLMFFFFRTMAISFSMMIGRIGAVTGNLLFPVLFNLTCLGPFFMIASVSLGKIILFYKFLQIVKYRDMIMMN